MKNLMLLVSFLGVLFVSCNKEEDVVTINDLKLLEEKYGVEIQNVQNAELTAEDLAIIEEKIIEMQQYLYSFNCEEIELEPVSNVLQSRAVKKGEASARAYNVSWVHIAVEVEDDKKIEIETWLTGITLYSFERVAIEHDFVPNKKQTDIFVDGTFLCTMNLIDFLGINLIISQQFRAKGTITLGSDNGILTVEKR